MSDYSVEITIGSHGWTFTHAADGTTSADGLTVLDGLSFGWSVPAGIWPAQPEAMTAGLTLNVPDFAALDIDNGDRIDIDVDYFGLHLVRPVASFHGRVTDAKAKARIGRPGMFVSVIAVDLTVDIGERPPKDFVFTPDVTLNDKFVLEAVMNELGSVKDTHYSDNTAPPVGIWPPQGPTDTRALLNQLLLQAVKVGENRSIWSPLLVGSGWVPTLDDVSSIPDVNAATPVTIPADAVGRDVAWSNVKGSSPSGIYTTGWGNNSTNVAKSTPTGTPSLIFADVPVTVDLETAAVDIADFYVTPFDYWQLDRVTVHADRAGYTIPGNLFPNWDLPVNDPDRAACYGAWVVLDGADPTRTPDGLDPAGVLTAATLNISGGALSLDLTIRRPQ